jgi:hypothetical protein
MPRNTGYQMLVSSTYCGQYFRALPSLRREHWSLRDFSDAQENMASFLGLMTMNSEIRRIGGRKKPLLTKTAKT